MEDTGAMGGNVHVVADAESMLLLFLIQSLLNTTLLLFFTYIHIFIYYNYEIKIKKKNVLYCFIIYIGTTLRPLRA